jgi:hypothetical protein
MKSETERLASRGFLGWWRLRRQSAKAGGTTSEHPNAEAPSVDYSLRSSGNTYIDHAGEAQRIVDRIKTSSASVIGIAGVRGAGKSSLAKKVLDDCNASLAAGAAVYRPGEHNHEKRYWTIAMPPASSPS